MSALVIFSEKGLNIELNTGYEGNEFSSTGNLGEDVLNITAVHPMREDAVEELIVKTNGSWSDIEYLVTTGKLVKSEFHFDYNVKVSLNSNFLTHWNIKYESAI